MKTLTKLFAFLMFATFVFSSCQTNKRYYGVAEFNLNSVQIIKNDSLITKNISNEKTYDDSLVNITFNVEKENIWFKLNNKTKKPISIDWNNTYFSINGSRSKVFHEGIKYIERNSAQLPTIIYPNEYHTDIIVPTENVYWRNSTYTSGYSTGYGRYRNYTPGTYTSGGWETKPLFPNLENWDINGNEKMDSISFDRYLETIKNNTKINVKIPIEINNENNIFDFGFTLKEIKKHSKDIPDKTNNALIAIPTGIILGLLMVFLIL